MVDKEAIKEAVMQAEALTSGEICIHLCKHTQQEDTLLEAQDIFERYGLYNTVERNAILIFVALESQRFAVLGDWGIHQKMGALFWEQIRDAMETEFRAGHTTEAIIKGIQLCGEHLKLHFPLTGNIKINQLSDNVMEDHGDDDNRI